MPEVEDWLIIVEGAVSMEGTVTEADTWLETRGSGMQLMAVSSTKRLSVVVNGPNDPRRRKGSLESLGGWRRDY